MSLPVLQSCAKACTCVVLTLAHPTQMVPLTTIVATMAKMAAGGNCDTLWSPLGKSFLTDSWRIWRNDMTMRMEKTRMPMGSSRRRPIGNFFRKPSTRQLTSLLVVQMMTVQSRSRAESTRDAIKDRELDQMAATPLAARRRMFTTTLICTLLVWEGMFGLRTYIDRPPRVLSGLCSPVALLFR